MFRVEGTNQSINSCAMSLQHTPNGFFMHVILIFSTSLLLQSRYTSNT